MTPTLWDMHVHLDFVQDMKSVAAKASDIGLGFFATTVTPEGYERARVKLADCGNVRVGVGLHPWWVADGRCTEQDVARAAELVRSSRFVGEIGLDLSPKHVPDGSHETQQRAFETVVSACAEDSDPESPKVLSIHSVRAAGATLDILEQTGCLGSCACIFHWFSGTSDELHQAVKAGCWFSINEMMLRTRRGREYARQLPAKRLLLETDLPEGEHVRCTATDIQASLTRTLEQLEAIRGADMRRQLLENSLLLLGDRDAGKGL